MARARDAPGGAWPAPLPFALPLRVVGPTRYQRGVSLLVGGLGGSSPGSFQTPERADLANP